MSKAQEIEPADVHGNLWTEAGRAARIPHAVRARLPESGYLCAQADIQVVTVGFVEIEQNIFKGRVSIRILDGGLHPGEHTDVIEFLLDIRLLDRRKRIPGL